jgi:ribosomal protein S14
MSEKNPRKGIDGGHTTGDRPTAPLRKQEMGMRRINFREKSYELSEHDFYYIINRIAEGYSMLANLYNDYHRTGFADVDDSFNQPDIGQKELENVYIAQVDDDKLSKYILSLIEEIQKMRDLDKEIIEWLAGYMGLPPLQNKKDKTRLKRHMRTIVSGGHSGSGPCGPVWGMQPEYQLLIEKSNNIIAEINIIYENIDKRIQQLLNGPILE